MDDEFVFLILGVGFVAAVVVGAIVAVQWRKLKTHELEADLKAEMVQRGMSADEIERVMKARFEPNR